AIEAGYQDPLRSKGAVLSPGRDHYLIGIPFGIRVRRDADDDGPGLAFRLLGAGGQRYGEQQPQKRVHALSWRRSPGSATWSWIVITPHRIPARSGRSAAARRWGRGRGLGCARP